VFYALTEGAERAFGADLAPPPQRGTAFEFYHAGVGLTARPASLIAGTLWQGIRAWAGFGPAAPFYFGAAQALLAAALLLVWI
jgi:hypothetical protein